MKVSKFTAEENIDERNAIKQHFKDGDDLQAIVAIKCLDEGVNIPGIRTAFILASTTNPKEYIQRRGRVLRKSPETGKEFAEIFDFVTLPRPLDEVSGLTQEQMRRDLSLVKNELARVLEFGRLSMNSMDWLYTAAVNGSHYAMYRLAKECLKGELIEKDIAHAVEWFAKSAERGNQYAQYMLGKLYLTGKEVPYDEEQAIHWLTRSAEQDNQYAQYLLEHLEENRPPSAMLAVTRLLHHMSRIFQDNSVPKSRPGGIQIDRKRLKKLQEKRIALGHKPDEHEQQWPDMTM